MPPEVIMVTNAVAPDKLGGLERYVRELAAALVRLGVPTSVVAKRVNPGDSDVQVGPDGVTVIRHDVPRKSDPFFAAKYPGFVRKGVTKALEARPNAIIHGHFPVPMMRLGRPGGTTRRRYLYTFHAPVHREILSERQGSYLLPAVVQRPVIGYFRRTEAAVVSRASTVAVLSDFMRRELAKLSPAAAATATLIPGGIDTGRFSPGPATPARDDAPVLFTARRLTPRTGVPALVSAMAAVVAESPRARLRIAGDGPLRAHVQRQIAELHLQEHVSLLGRISNEELVEEYRRASFTVMPTAELEGFGLTTAESLACGTPVLVTPVGANPELLRGMNALFVTRGADQAALAAGILRLLATPEVVAAARSDLRSATGNPWSWDVVANRYAELYERHRRTAR